MKNKGFTILLCFGKWTRPHIIWKLKTTGSFRLCLGWIALSIYLYDYESSVHDLLNKNKEQNIL